MTDLSLDGLCVKVALIKQAKAKQEQILAELNDEILDRLNTLGVHSLTTEEGRKITAVRSSSKEWDMTILKDILVPMGLWEAVTFLKEELDREKLETLLDRERVNEADLLPALTVKERKPYPKIS